MFELRDGKRVLRSLKSATSDVKQMVLELPSRYLEKQVTDET